MRTVSAVLLVALSAATAVSASRITSISPRSGGVQGGTRVTVLGEGFDIRGRSNDVYIGGAEDGVFCDPVPNECHGERIVCLTDPARTLRGWQRLSVKSFGFVASCDYSRGCEFKLSHDDTPRMQAVRPDFVTRVQDITVTGESFEQGDATVANFDFSMWIGDEERCNFETPRTVSWDSFTCGMESLPFAGDQRVRLQMGTHGDATQPANLKMLVVPTITGVSPSNGSVAGGQRLTVYGTALGRDITHIKVRVHGSPCQVVEVSEHYAVCITTAHAPTTTAQPQYRQGEALLESWRQGERSLSRFYDNRRSLKTEDSRIVTSVGGSNWFGELSATTTRFTSLFVPNVTGNHTFTIRGDDNAELWIGEDEDPVARVKTAVTDADRLFERRIAYVPSYTWSYTDERFPYQNGWVELEAGKKYWLQVVVANGDGGSSVAVRASVPGHDGYLFSGDIPSEFLTRRVNTWTPPIELNSIDVPAIVGDACTLQGACDFNFLAERTPGITSVNPAAISGESSTITIEGSNFGATAAANIVTVGGVPCAVSTASSTELVCTTETSVPTGVHYVRVTVVGRGRAANSIAVTASPTVTSVSHVAADVEILGTGFGMHSSRVTVQLDSTTCTVTSVTNERIACTADATLGTGSVTATVNVRQDEAATMERAFVFKQAFERPGTTTAPGSARSWPTAGSVAGNTLITVEVPGWAMRKTNLLTVTVGSTACELVHHFHSRAICRTLPGAIGTNDVTVTYDGSSVRAGRFSYREEVLYVSPSRLGTKGGNRLYIRYEGLGHNASDVSVSYGGSPCAVTSFNGAEINCYVGESRPTSFPTVAEYSHTDSNVAASFFLGPKASVTSNGFSIPEGSFMATRRVFNRPMRMTARVKVSEARKQVRMSALIDDPSSTHSGYSGFGSQIYYGEDYLGIRVDHWTARRKAQNKDALIGTQIVAGSYQTWRLDILPRVIRFYLDDIFVDEYFHDTNKMGHVGFVSPSTDIEVRDIKVEDLRAMQLQVNLSGVPLYVEDHEHPYDSVKDHRPVTGVSPTTFSGGEWINVVGTSFRTGSPWMSMIDAASSENAPLTVDAQPLCEKINYPENTLTRCRVSKSLAPGTYYLRYRQYDNGYSHNAVAVTVVAKMDSVSPRTLPPAGGVVTIMGAGFPKTISGTTVTVGGNTCEVLEVGSTYVRCSITTITGVDNAVALSISGTVVTACTECSVSVSTVDAPNVTSISTTIYSGRHGVYFSGVNLGNGRIVIGNTECRVYHSRSDRIRCIMPMSGFSTLSGSQTPVVEIFGKGYAILPQSSSITFEKGVYDISPNRGSPLGGSSVTMFGQGFTVPQGTQAERTSFASGNGLNGWTFSNVMPNQWFASSSTPFTTCDSRIPRMLGGVKAFDHRTSVSKTITSIPTHTHLSVRVVAALVDGPWTNHESLVITIDGTPYQLDGERAMQHRNINDESACGNSDSEWVLDIAFVVPHTSGAADVVITRRGFGFSEWGILSTRFGAIEDGAVGYSATVGGVACPVTYIDAAVAVCRTPVIASGTHAMELSEGSTALPCRYCEYETNSTTGAPNTKSFGPAPVSPVQGASTTLDWTYVHPNIKIVTDGSTFSFHKTKGSGWSGTAQSSQLFEFDSGLEGIEFDSNIKARTFVGFRDNSRTVQLADHHDIDFALYNDFRTPRFYESSQHRFANSGVANGKYRIMINRATGQVTTYYDDRVLFHSTRRVRWPLSIRIAMHDPDTMLTGLRPIFAAGAPTAVTHQAVMIGVMNQDRVEINNPQTTVTVNGSDCIGVVAQKGHVTCWVPTADVPTLGQSVAVAVSNRFGVGPAVAASYTALLGSVSHTAGSANGGHRLTLTGSGFDLGTLAVSVGSTSCDVVSSTKDTVVCTTAALSDGDHSVTVSVDGVQATCLSPATPIPYSTHIAAASSTDCSTFVYAVNASAADVPAITSVSPATVQESSVVTITGSNLPTDSTPSVWFVGGGKCMVSSATNTTIVCTVQSIAGGSSTLTATYPSYGNTNAFAITATLSVTSTETHAIGNLGGARITLNGHGFGSDVAAVSITDSGSTSRCSSIELVSSAQLVCVAAAGTYTQNAANDLVLRVSSTSASVDIGLVSSTARIAADASNAATITSAVPAKLAYGDMLFITGTNLADTSSVTVGSETCTVGATTSTSVSCVLSGAIAASPASDVSLTTSSRGVATSSATVAGTLGVNDVQKARARGGEVITITGTAFSTTASDFNVMVGGYSCAVQSATETMLTCELPETPSNFVGRSLDVTVLRKGSDVSATDSLAYVQPVAPTVSNVAPTLSSAAGGDILTVTGTGFDSGASRNVVTVGGERCAVVSGSTTQLLCILSALSTQSTSASVLVTTNGMASNSNVAVNMQLSVASLSVADGDVKSLSNEGGLVLTVTGTGFPIMSYQTDLVKIHVGDIECPVTSTSATELQCTLPAMKRPRENTPALVNSYPAKPDGMQNVTVKVNGSTAEIDTTTTYVQYVNSATPTVTGVSGAGTSMNDGASLTITGTGFALSGNKVYLRRFDLNPNSSTCDVTSESSTEIVCTIQATTFGSHAVRVVVPGKGAAYTGRSCASGEYLMCDGTCLTDADCTYADWGVFGDCAALADLTNDDAFCHSNGGTDRVNIPMKLDNEKAFNLNCPMYSCEGGDCDTKLEIGGVGARISTCRADPNGYEITLKPKITALSSVKASSINGGLRITVTGTGFKLGGTVASLSGSICTVVEATSTQVVCETAATPASTGRTLLMWTDRVEADCATDCTGFSFEDDATPVMSTVSPTSSRSYRGRCSQGIDVTITGTGFSSVVDENKLSVGGYLATVKAASTTQLTFECPALVKETYSVSLRVVGKGTATATAVRQAVVVPAITAISTNVTSMAGGQTITLYGNGFNYVKSVTASRCTLFPRSWNATTVVAYVVSCTSTSSSGSRITTMNWDDDHSDCNALDGLDCRLHSKASTTPTVSGVTQNGDVVTIAGSFLGAAQADVTVSIGTKTCDITAFSDSQLTCTAAADHHAGTFLVRTSVAAYGFAQQELAAVKTYDLTVASVTPASGSLGGGQLLTIAGSGFASDNSLNSVVIGGNRVCEVQSANLTQIVCKTAASSVAGAADVNVTVSSGVEFMTEVTHSVAGNQFTYDSALTPMVSSISPYAGSTAGGTALTITGSNLAAVNRVTIAGRDCSGVSVTNGGTTLQCSTGSNELKTDENPVIIASTPSNGDAVLDAAATYQYIDLWSRWTTWGNRAPPVEGDSAVVSEGQTVILDMTPPRLFLIIVMGHFKFEQTKNLTLEATYIMVNFGRFTIGTPDAPFTNQATIRLYGDRLTPEIPVHGSKVLAVRHGAIDMHGIERKPTWTTLSATADDASNTIQVLGPVDWVAGDVIVVASTDYKVEHAEQRTIVAVSGGDTATVTLTLNEPLEYYHYGERQCFDDGSNKPVCVDEVAEVLLLSRNVILEGDSETKRIGFGGTAFLMPLGQSEDKHVRMSYVEFRDVGQQYIVGRYPVHFHVTHTINNSYVNGTSVHHSLNRAFSIHGTDNNTYVNNVVYDTGGHAFFIEDGSERWNVIDNNAVILARSSTSNLNTDVTPACFWIVSMSNKVTNNRACGSHAYGFWVSPFHPHSTGPTFSPDICPATHPLWQMENNTAHSNAKYGLNIFRFWWPKKRECDFNGPDEQAIIRNHLSFKNKIHGVTMAHSEVGSIGAVKMDNLTSADNGELHQDGSAFWVEHIKAENMTYGVQNSLLIALTNNQPHRRRLRRRAINLPLGDNFFSENVTFVNYDNENFGYEPQAWAERMSFCFPWGWEAVSSGLRWINSPNRALFRFHHHGVLNDVDGTLTSVANSQLAPKVPIYDPAHCSDSSGYNTLIPSVVCTAEHKIRRFGVSTIDSVWQDQLWTVEGRTEAVPEIKHKYSIAAPINKEVFIDFNFAYNPTEWHWKMDDRFYQPGERTLFTTNYSRNRWRIRAKYDDSSEFAEGSDEPITLATENVTWNRVDNRTFRVLFAHPQKKVTVVAEDCPPEGCPTAPAAPPAVQKSCGSWDDPTAWASGVAPVDGNDLNVTFQDSVCLDRANGTYHVASLYVQGTVTIRDEHCPASGVVTFYVSRYIHINGGNLRLGNITHPISACRVRVVMGPVAYGNGAQNRHILLPWGPRSITVEAGKLSLVGTTPAVLSSRLAATASSGATSIVLEDTPSEWRVGDHIVISSTARHDMFNKLRENPERAVIAAVSGNTITLAAPLDNEHFGAPRQTLNGTSYSVGASVALVNRTVEVVGHDAAGEPQFGIGWNLNIGCHDSNTKGCGAEGQGSGMSRLKTADVRLSGARFSDIGQRLAFFSGIEIDSLISSVDGSSAQGSVIEKCFFDSVWNNAIGIRDTTSNMTVRNNVIYNVRGDGMRVIGAHNRLEGNLVIGALESLMGCGFTYKFVGPGTEDCRPAGYRVARLNTLINNRVAGATSAGFVTDGDECGASTQWIGNEADSTRDGLLIYDRPSEPKYNWPVRPYTCRWARGVRVQNSQDHGVAVWYATGNLVVSDIVAVDNMVAIMPLMFSTEVDRGQVEQHVSIRDSVVAGKWPVQSCREQRVICRKTLLDSKPWCKTFMDYAPFMSNVGIMESVFVHSEFSGRTKGEHKFMWMEADSYATLHGRAAISNVHFDQFEGHNSCDRYSVAFFQNPFSNDTFHQHTFSNIQWGAGMGEGGEFRARTMYGDISGHRTVGVQSTWLDWDNIKFGAYWPDAPNKVWLTDVDGTFTRSSGMAQVLASQTMTRDNIDFQSLPWDGSGLRDLSTLGEPRAGCTSKSAWNAFVCDSQFEMLSLVIEHLGEDKLTRRAGPVVLCKGNGMMGADGKPLCQGSVIDFASGPVMKGKVQRATLDRQTRFRFVAERNGNYTLYFRGQPPAWMRLRVTNSEYLQLDAPAGITINVRYFGLNAESRVGILANGRRRKSIVARADPWTLTPAVTWPAPTDVSGTHFHNKKVEGGVSTNVLSVAVRAGDVVDLRQEPIVVVNMDVAMPIDEFFNNQDTFAAAMAQVLGIDASRMRFVEIVPGTTRRRQSEMTRVGIEIGVTDSASEQAAEGGRVSTVNDLSDVHTRVQGLDATVGAFNVANVDSSFVDVKVEAPELVIGDGVDYILYNVTTSGQTFDRAAIAEGIASYILTRYGSSAAPQNETTLDDVAVGNVFTDANNYTRFTVSFAYEEDMDSSNAALAELARQVAQWPTYLPSGYSVASFNIVSSEVTTAATTTVAATTTAAGATTTAAAGTTTSGAPGATTTTTTTAAPVTPPPTIVVPTPPTNNNNTGGGSVEETNEAIASSTGFIVAMVVGFLVVVGVAIALVVYFLVIKPSKAAQKAAGNEFDGVATANGKQAAGEKYANPPTDDSMMTDPYSSQDPYSRRQSQAPPESRRESTAVSMPSE